jgi:multiple sugar transport system substrate-binding protein
MQWRKRLLALAVLGSLILAACGGGAAQSPTTAPAAPGGSEAAPTAAAGGDAQVITMWAPNAERCDPAEEWGTVVCMVEEFNQQNNGVQVQLTSAPIDQWTNYVNSGALAGDLPDVLYFDGPTLANFAWAGHLRPIDEYVTPELESDFLPSVALQNQYNDQWYAVSAFDGGFGIWANRSYLEQAGVRIPTSVDDAWTREEFEDALAKLQALEGIDYAMDMKMNYGQGEWFTYGFSPILQSMGGDLIDREAGRADGILNGPASVEAMQLFQSWIQQGYVNATPAGDTDFDEGKTALSWVGHWMYSRYNEALGDDLIVVPMPKLGERAATGLGSWAMAMTSNASNPDAAWQVMEYLIQPEQIARLTAVNGAVPARVSALESSELYREGGPLHVLVQQLQEVAVARPVTPAYPVITSSFAQAVNDIAQGADVQSALDQAAQQIDQDIQDNNGYAPSS